jgi:hypothetical protein
MPEDRVLRRTSGTERDEINVGWRKLHDKELHNLYSAPCIIKVTKLRTVRWAGYVTRM